MSKQEKAVYDLEIALLKAGLRQVARKDLVPAAEAGEFARGLEAQGLHAFIVPQPHDTDPETGEFTYHTGGGYLTVIAARDAGSLFKAAGCVAREVFSDLELPETMGLLLGYPECCIRAHNEHADDKDVSRAAIRSLAGTAGELSPFLDVFSPQRFIVHSPCAFDCAESVQLARAALEFLKPLGAAAPEARKTILLADGSYARASGSVSGLELRYDPATLKGTARELIELMKSGKSCAVGKNTLQVSCGGETVEYQAEGIYLFNFGGPNIYGAAPRESKSSPVEPRPNPRAEAVGKIASRAEKLAGGAFKLTSMEAEGRDVILHFTSDAGEFRLFIDTRPSAAPGEGSRAGRFAIKKGIDDMERAGSNPSLAKTIEAAVEAFTRAEEALRKDVDILPKP